MNITCTCGKPYQSKTAPCPDGIEGCLVVHYAEKAHVCPACGRDNTPDLSKGVWESIGIGVFNPKGLSRLAQVVESTPHGPEGQAFYDAYRKGISEDGNENK